MATTPITDIAEELKTDVETVRKILAKIAPDHTNKQEIPDSIAIKILEVNENFINALNDQQSAGVDFQEAVKVAGAIAVTKDEQIAESVACDKAALMSMIEILSFNAAQEGAAIGELYSHVKQSAFIAASAHSDEQFLQAFLGSKAVDVGKAIEAIDVNSLLEKAGLSIPKETLSQTFNQSSAKMEALQQQMRKLRTANYLNPQESRN